MRWQNFVLVKQEKKENTISVSAWENIYFSDLFSHFFVLFCFVLLPTLWIFMIFSVSFWPLNTVLKTSFTFEISVTENSKFKWKQINLIWTRKVFKRCVNEQGRIKSFEYWLFECDWSKIFFRKCDRSKLKCDRLNIPNLT